MAESSRTWKGLWLPSLLFILTFGFAVAIKCLQPDINFYNTEGLTDLTRILDFCLGDTVPPQDCWLPPYPHIGYYTFMHYGASVLKRLLSVDIGTAYNLASALLNALTLLVCAATAHHLGRFRWWMPVLVLVVVAGGFTGSTPILALLHPTEPNPTVSIDIGINYENPELNIFSKILQTDPPVGSYRLYTPGCYLYYSEFHATIAGHFLTLLAVFGVVEVLRRKRTIVPWVYLAVAPALIVISCPWLFIIVLLLSWPTLVLAWLTMRRPVNLRAVLVGTTISFILLWPTLNDLTRSAIAQPMHVYTEYLHDFWIILIQFWPLYLPWLALFFVWKRLGLAGRWLYLLLVPLFILSELIFFQERGTTTEKTCSAVFGIGMVVLYPLLFAQKHWVYRSLSGVILVTGLISIYAWSSGIFLYEGNWQDSLLHLEGQSFIQRTPQLKMMESILSRLRAQTVLTGKNMEAFFESPTLSAFTENRTFVGWTNAEESCGHPDEAHDRARQTNAFYDGTLADPLAFLQGNNIAAVLVWPNDKMSDEWLNKIKIQLGSNYAYFDCKGDGPDNAGVFIGKTAPQQKTKPSLR